MTNES